MISIVRITLQAGCYAGFALAVGFFATQPEYRYADPGSASIKVSLSHAADRVEPCVQLTPEEIAELAANMRRTETCARERLPLILELDIDDQAVLRIDAPPAGLWGDGPSSIYERFSMEPGTHRVSVRLRDTHRDEGWDYTMTEDVVLEAGRYLTITFRPETGGFHFR